VQEEIANGEITTKVGSLNIVLLILLQKETLENEIL